MWRKVWIWKRKKKSGRTYCLRWHDDNGHVRTEAVGPERKVAERLRAEREIDLNAGKLNIPERISYEAFVQEELEAMKGRLSENSLAMLKRTLEDFGRACKVKMLDNVKPLTVEQYLSRRLKKAKPATANKNLRTLKAALNRAVRRGRLERNPAAEVKAVREPEKDIRVLSVEELDRLLSVCPSIRWKALIALAVTTGMRLGEMLALQWKDLEGGIVRIRNKPSHLTKSRRNRVVALLPEACALLEQLPRKGELVFHLNGQPWKNNIQRGFRRMVKEAGIDHCSIHDLRRTFASHLAMAGVNEAVVQKLAGHASVETTLRHYTNILPEAMRDAQARLPFRNILADVSKSDRERFSGFGEKTAKVLKLGRAAS